MNYRKIYNNLVEKRRALKPHGYTERHHIIPKSLGGSNEISNLVDLTAREHFIAHLLLSKMYVEGSIQWVKMQKALIRMFSESYIQERYSPSRWYAYAKEKVAVATHINQSGKGNSQYGKVWVYNESLKLSTSIQKSKLSEYLNSGWKIGRVVKWNDRSNKARGYLSPQQRAEKERKTAERARREKANIDLYSKYYLLYNELGWKGFIATTGYNKSKPNLVSQFKRYVKEFVPQNGKKRGK